MGDVVPACLLAWAPQMGMPLGLSMGGITWNLNSSAATEVYDAEIALGRTAEQAVATLNKAKAESGIARIGSFRLAMNDFTTPNLVSFSGIPSGLGSVTSVCRLLPT